MSRTGGFFEEIENWRNLSKEERRKLIHGLLPIGEEVARQEKIGHTMPTASVKNFLAKIEQWDKLSQEERELFLKDFQEMGEEEVCEIASSKKERKHIFMLERIVEEQCKEISLKEISLNDIIILLEMVVKFFYIAYIEADKEDEEKFSLFEKMIWNRTCIQEVMDDIEIMMSFDAGTYYYYREKGGFAGVLTSKEFILRVLEYAGVPKKNQEVFKNLYETFLDVGMRFKRRKDLAIFFMHSMLCYNIECLDEGIQALEEKAWDLNCRCIEVENETLSYLERTCTLMQEIFIIFGFQPEAFRCEHDYSDYVRPSKESKTKNMLYFKDLYGREKHEWISSNLFVTSNTDDIKNILKHFNIEKSKLTKQDYIRLLKLILIIDDLADELVTLKGGWESKIVYDFHREVRDEQKLRY